MPTAPITYKQINPKNAFLARQTIERYDFTTNAYIPWTGGVNVRVGYYLDATGTQPIVGMVDFEMDEVAGEAGTYAFVVPSAVMNGLLTMNGTVIYQIVTAGAPENMKVVTPLKVTVPRWAQ